MSVVSPELRRIALRGLGTTARRIVRSVLLTYGDWDEAWIQLLRNYGLSCARLETLQAAPDVDVRKVHREIRVATLLLESLELEPKKT